MFKNLYPFRDKMPVYHYPMPLTNASRDICRGKHLNGVDTKKVEGHNLYVHIPFCKSICTFCPYVKYVYNKETADRYIKTLKKEMQMYAESEFAKSLKFTALYFGGGTPSILPAEQLVDLLDTLGKYFNIQKDPEITIEGSPSSFSFEKFSILKQNGVNRVSMGVQTFNPNLSVNLELPQDPAVSIQAVEDAMKAGIGNISIDLIYNTPGQSLKSWENDLKQAVKLGLNQVTLFPMVVAPFSKIYKLMAENKVEKILSDEEEYKFYEMGMQILGDNGYRQISNYDWDREGTEFIYCKQHFGDLSDILGMGASSFGEINKVAYINTGALQEYFNLLDEGLLPIKSYDLTQGEEMFQHVVLKSKGLKVSQKSFRERFHVGMIDVWGDTIRALKEKGLIEVDDYYISATKLGSFYLNNISKEFFSERYKNTNPYEVTSEKLSR